MAFTFDWSAESIKSVLRQNDRFTLWDLTKGFEADPMRDAVLFDPARNLYATPASRERYMVIWQHEPGANIVKPGFAVAKQYRGETPEELKAKLEKIILAQSHGRYTLDNLFGETPDKNAQNNLRQYGLPRPQRSLIFKLLKA